MEKVFPNELGKSVHLFTAQSYLDYVKQSLPKPLTLDKFEDATSRIGLGWLARSSNLTSEITGIEDCTTYLRDLTWQLWLEIRKVLKLINKEQIIEYLLLNNDSIEADTQHWQRTLQALLGLHSNKQDVYNVVLEKVSSNNAAALGTRLIIEMALCECQSHDGIPPNKLDISKLITYAASIFQYGNLSDAIKFEMVQPLIRISSFGDVQFDNSFYDLVVAPYGNIVQKSLIDNASRKHAREFQEPQYQSSSEGMLEKQFISAWSCEYGLSIDAIRQVVDFFENLGYQKNSAVIKIGKTELIERAIETGISREVMELYLRSFTLHSREEWSKVPTGFKVNDISPWKFRRRLSVITKPIIEFEGIIYLSPNLIRNGFGYVFSNAYDASLDGSFFKTKKMKSWIGNQRNITGHKFNHDAANKFKQYGWQAEPDVKVTKILNMKLDKNYGDVDVLAWNPESKVIYLIECKDLEFAKNQGEIAKQVYEYRGMHRENGKPDRLRKHIDRCDILKRDLQFLKNHLNIDNVKEVKTVLLFKQTVPIPFAFSDESSSLEIYFYNDLDKVL